VQFIEVNAFEVNAAIHELARPSDSARVILFPMVHGAEESFYQDIAVRAAECDAVVFEGVRSPFAAVASWSYGLFAARLGLVSQNKFPMSEIRGKLVHADIDSREFAAGFAQLPLAAKLLLPVFLPTFAIYFLFAGDRSWLARHLEVSDLALRESILDTDPDSEALDDLLLARRDLVLMKRLEAILSQSSGAGRIGVLYGAAHMPAVYTFLTQRLRFRVVRSGWTRVFSLV